MHQALTPTAIRKDVQKCDTDDNVPKVSLACRDLALLRRNQHLEANVQQCLDPCVVFSHVQQVRDHQPVKNRLKDSCLKPASILKIKPNSGQIHFLKIRIGNGMGAMAYGPTSLFLESSSLFQAGVASVLTSACAHTHGFFYQRIPLQCVCSLVSSEALSASLRPSDGRGIIAFKRVSRTSVQGHSHSSSTWPSWSMD